MKSIIVLGLLASGIASSQSYDTNYGTNSFAHLSNGSYNSAFGYSSMFYDSTGYYNSAFGAFSLFQNSTGCCNVAFGTEAAYNNISNGNTAIGFEAMYGSQTGSGNIAIGEFAGYNLFAGSNNIEIGNQGLANDKNVIRIGTQGVQKFTQVAGIYGVKLVGGGQAVYVNAKGQLGIVNTKIITSVSPVTQADVLSLRQEIASLHNEMYALKAQIAAKAR